MNNKPFVSICTPTFNRRPFFPAIIKCIENQDYPVDLLEWIIIDDGTDLIEDLVKDISIVKYYKYKDKMTLGKKRNLMHEKCSGDIIVYMDDDDYYPPQRISHSVERLLSDDSVLCAGSSEIYIYFKNLDEIYKFGPYGENHATAGTFAFKKSLLNITSYDDNACIAEEKHFLKNYTIPFIQLDPLKTILVFSHIHNTFNKSKLLEKENDLINISNKKIKHFIKDKYLIDFFLTIDEKLKLYSPGKPSMKPDVIKQIIDIEKKRKETYKKERVKIIINGKKTRLNVDEISEIINKQQLDNNILKQELEFVKKKYNNLIENYSKLIKK